MIYGRMLSSIKEWTTSRSSREACFWPEFFPPECPTYLLTFLPMTFFFFFFSTTFLYSEGAGATTLSGKVGVGAIMTVSRIGMT